MNKAVIFFIISLNLYSCLNMNDPKRQAIYIESYNSFNKEMVKHFPKKMPNNKILFSFNSPEYINKRSYPAKLYLKTKLSSKEKYRRLTDQFKKEAKIIKNSTDSCCLIITSASTFKHNISDCEKYYPIPIEIAYYFDDKNLNWVRQEKSKVVFLDYRPGVFTDNLVLKKDTLLGKWENGYSKGYSFNDNEQTISYWLIIW